MSNLVALMLAGSGDWTERYNSELREFYEHYAKYVSVKWMYEGLVPIQLDLAVANTGTCPGENVTLRLSFPEGLQLFEKDAVPRLPPEPKPPAKPGSHSAPWLPGVPKGLLDATLPPVFASRLGVDNVSTWTIRQVNGHEAAASVRSVQHYGMLDLDPLCVWFRSYEDTRSFGISYELVADNIPQVIQGELGVVIEKG